MDMITVPGNCQGSCQVQWAVAHNLMSDSPFFVARKIKKEPALGLLSTFFTHPFLF